MVKITLDLLKSVERNAEIYFTKSKKAKKKLEKTITALTRIKKRQLRFNKEREKRREEELEKEKELKQISEKEWYEKFHWFTSSEDFLVIGGKDATSNEIVVKKHTDPDDIIFHTDIAGSPFFIIKTKGKKPGKTTLQETAIATASYSRAWKLGIPSAEVFYVSPDQVTKKAKAGEYISKGAFMVYGKKNFLKAELGLAIGLKDNKVMAAALSAVKKHCKEYLEVQQGKEKKSAIAKKIQKKIKAHVDDIIRVLPTGGLNIKK